MILAANNSIFANFWFTSPHHIKAKHSQPASQTNTKIISSQDHSTIIYVFEVRSTGTNHISDDVQGRCVRLIRYS